MMKTSVVTLVNDWEAYARNVCETLRGDSVEFVPVLYPKSAASGLNEGLLRASNNVVAMCHQDVVFPPSWISTLEAKLAELGNFGVAGTYGVKLDASDGAGRVRSGDKELFRGPLPCRASYLDEHCIIIRKDSGLRFDESLAGFHMYAADLCMMALSQGLDCWVIDAKVHHLSDNLGTDPALDEAVAWFVNKWRGRAPVHRYRTTCRGNISL